jgi:MFS family permease
MEKTSTWYALRNPIYRGIWLASLVSGTCVAAHDMAATWMMNHLGASTFMISLMSTVASLPFFLFTLPAGALADMVSRRKLLVAMSIWSACTAWLLGILGLLGLLHPAVILASVFFIGIGAAFNAPAWAAIIPEVVRKDQLPSAATLSGLQFNLSGIVGPALGGALVPLIGANALFVVNGFCFLVVIWALLRWRKRKRRSMLPVENFIESFTTAIRYVRYAPGIQVVLVRNIFFAFFISVIPALLPVFALKLLHLDPSRLGLLFTSMGAGSVVGAVFIIPFVRARFSSNAITVLANGCVAIVFLLMAVVRSEYWAMGVAALAGIGWTLAASELWVAGQRAMPSWARGRMNATIIMVSQGAMALGGVIWGSSAQIFGINVTLTVGAVALAASLLLAIPLSINFLGALNFDPAPVTSFNYKLIHTPQPHDGPISVTVEFQVDRLRGKEFVELMREVRLIHLRNGAYSWRLHEDLTRVNTYRIEILVPSWTEYLLQHERMTVEEKEVIERANALHVGEEPPVLRYYLSVDRELLEHSQRAEERATPPAGVRSAEPAV